MGGWAFVLIGDKYIIKEETAWLVCEWELRLFLVTP
jgi:hypothetical protein